MDVIVLHDPRNPASRKVVELLEAEGLEPLLLEYLREPPSPEELRTIIRLMAVGPRKIMRTKEPLYRQLGLDDPTLSEGQLLEAMCNHPHLIDGPIVVTEDQAVLARPVEKVFNVI